MPSILKVEIIGHAGKDAEMRFLPNGTAVASFSVAHSDKYKNANGEEVKQTIWMRVSVFGKLAEVCNQYVKKGMLVRAEGKLKGDENGNPRIYTKQDGTAAASFEMVANEVTFLSRVEGQAAPVVDDESDSPF